MSRWTYTPSTLLAAYPLWKNTNYSITRTLILSSSCSFSLSLSLSLSLVRFLFEKLYQIRSSGSLHKCFRIEYRVSVTWMHLKTLADFYEIFRFATKGRRNRCICVRPIVSLFEVHICMYSYPRVGRITCLKIIGWKYTMERFREWKFW